MGTVIGPQKANPPLIVDADAVLSLTIALQRPSFDVCPARDGLSVISDSVFAHRKDWMVTSESYCVALITSNRSTSAFKGMRST